MNSLSKLLIIVVCSALTALAQEPPSAAPATTPQAQQEPAATESPRAGAQPGASGDAVETEPEIRSAGGTLLLPADSVTKRSMMVPEFSVLQAVESEPPETFAGSQRGFLTILSGNLWLQHLKKRDRFNLRYHGQASIRQRGRNEIAHFLSLSNRYASRRWRTRLDAQLFYSPESTFGYPNPSAPNRSGVGVDNSALDPRLVPSQTILTVDSSRLGVVTAAQFDYMLNPKSALTFTAGAGTLRSPGGSPTFLESNQYSFTAGYNRNLSRSDSIGVYYVGSLYRFVSSGREINAQAVQLYYEHNVRGRLSLQISGGPQRLHFVNAATNRFSARAGLYYRTTRSALSVAFSRDITTGSGVFDGAAANIVEVNASRLFNRRWSGTLVSGYARNEPLLGVSVPALTVHTVYAGGVVSRLLSERVSAFLSYNLQHESFIPTCPNCLNSRARHVGGIGFSWSPRPIALR